MLSKKHLEKMLRKFNMNVREVDANKVTIECSDKKIVITNPEVMVMNLMNKEVYQITGEINEILEPKEEDIKLVMEKTGADKETVVEMLKKLNNDLARVIKELKEKQ